MTVSTTHLKDILSHVEQGGRLDSAGRVVLLNLEQESDLSLLFETAREVRRTHFGQNIFTYGFAYTSTFCRNDCAFCYFRRSNTQPERYRKKPEDIHRVARYLYQEGVHLIDLTMGEDPRLSDAQNEQWDVFIQLVRDIKKETGLPIMVSPGVIPDPIMERLAAVGVTWYACYQETHNPILFSKLRIGQSYETRLAQKRLAKKMGLLIEEGILCGVGESPSDIAHSMDVMQAIDADQVRVMKFVPQPGTPMAEHAEENSLRECLIIAVLRLSFPDRLIPATLDVDGLAGLRMRWDAGANVITSLVPPDYGLSGVANCELDIENANRTMAGILPILAQAGLSLAGNADYRKWIRRRQKTGL